MQRGFDAIDIARMGTSNSKYDKVTWREAMGAKERSGACGQANDKNVEIQNTHVIDGEVHCIEPLPFNYKKLVEASDKLGWNDESIVISKAAISSSNGMVKFPDYTGTSPDTGQARPEGNGIETCHTDPTAVCVDVPQYSLQSYVNKFVKSSTGPINFLSIDVEGYDFDVLFGAGNVLDRTEYLEFEFHEVGDWANYHIMDAVNLLNQKGFTCYWLGTDLLWRLTGCHHKYYDTYHRWSNVGCVHRSQKKLAEVMEIFFRDN